MTDNIWMPDLVMSCYKYISFLQATPINNKHELGKNVKGVNS